MDIEERDALKESVERTEQESTNTYFQWHRLGLCGYSNGINQTSVTTHQY